MRKSHNAHSINTILLQIFSLLTLHNRSFSVGDVALLDDEDKLYNEMLAQSSPADGVWREIVLKVPIEKQCNCAGCTKNSRIKRAIRFIKIPESYLLVKIVENPSYSLDGVFEALRLSFWGSPHMVDGCAVRSSDWLPYSMAKEDEQTIKAILPQRKREISLEQLRHYNKTARQGSEFFVPPALLENDRIFN